MSLNSKQPLAESIADHLGAIHQHWLKLFDAITAYDRTASLIGSSEPDPIAQLLRFQRLALKNGGRAFGLAPGLAILLEVLRHERIQQRATMKALALTAGLPTTTAIRWTREFERKLLIQRHEYPGDRRIAWFTLTDTGRDQIERLIKPCLEATNQPSNRASHIVEAELAARTVPQ